MEKAPRKTDTLCPNRSLLGSQETQGTCWPLRSVFRPFLRQNLTGYMTFSSSTATFRRQAKFDSIGLLSFWVSTSAVTWRVCFIGYKYWSLFQNSEVPWTFGHNTVIKHYFYQRQHFDLAMSKSVDFRLGKRHSNDRGRGTVAIKEKCQMKLWLKYCSQDILKISQMYTQLVNIWTCQYI